ncbi:MAG: hypothetical protein GQE15_18540 [Archangiaceae bacterium]|nr:hypothetical protein [Archangiaceae bacterium]
MKRLLLVATLALSSVALADLVSDTESACRDKKAGDACRASLSAGVCTASKCSRNDYSEGIPPKQKVVDCLKCLEATTDGGVATKKPKKTYGSAP